jgi:glycosyltransferase involved in cell wall biosynthesis
MIKYATSNDPSGYGEAARMDIHALYMAGANITTEIAKQMAEQTNYGISGALVKALENRDIDYQFKIIHLTPDLYPRYIEKGKYNIARLFWETDRLPKEWVEPCNAVDEIWTASENMQKMIIDSGVRTPVYCFPQPIDTSLENIKPFGNEKDFIFYSIFQWIARKNPRTLLRAYWKEFEGNDKVTLLLKTYGVTYQKSEFDRIKAEIEGWKKELNLKSYPKIWLCEKLLSENEVKKLHVFGDCYISPSSGEGWARGTHEAMLYGKPVISGDVGGITDYITNYYKVESKEVRATVQSFIPWYTQEQFWKELDEDSLRKQMRLVFSQGRKNALEAQNAVKSEMSLDKVGKMMQTRLECISAKNVSESEKV